MAFRPITTPIQHPKPTFTTLTELGLMTGTQDPMMLFPAGTEFTPFSVIRNVSSTSVTLTPEIFWMDRGAMHRHQLNPLQLQANQTVMLDTSSLLREAGLSDYNGMLNLTFTTTASPNALLLASGSVDQTGTYVFQVLAHEVRESMAKSISYWSTGNGDDTMVTVWNPADEAQDFLFTLHYEGGSYVLPLHLDARATRFFNIASLIQDQLPDAYGHVIPATITSGSARLTGARADNENILVDLDAGSYNVRKATCWYYCISCSGGVNSVIALPTDVALSSQAQMSFLVKQDSGLTYDYSTSASWTSGNTQVATFATGGKANGLAVGTFLMTAGENIPIYSSYYCAYNAYCPDLVYISASGGGQVWGPVNTKTLITNAQNGFSANCDAKFSKVIPGYTKSGFFNSLSATTIYQYPPGTPNIPTHQLGIDASTDTSVKGSPISLWPNFYGLDATTQSFVLVHEGIHHFTGWLDSQVFSNFAAYGLKQTNPGTGDITVWIQGGCKP